MNKKIGSIYIDMIKPLENKIYKGIQDFEDKCRRHQDKQSPHLRGISYDDPDMLAYASLRKHVPKIAEFIVGFSVQRDAHIKEIELLKDLHEDIVIEVWMEQHDVLFSCHCNDKELGWLDVENLLNYKNSAEWSAYLQGRITTQKLIEGLHEMVNERYVADNKRYLANGVDPFSLIKSPSVKEWSEEAIRSRIDAATAWMEKYCVPLSRDFNVEPESISLGYSVKAEDTQDDDAPIEKNEWKDKPPLSPIFEDRFVPRFWAWQDELGVYMSLCIQYEIAKDVFIPVPEVVLEKAKMQKGSTSEECSFVWNNMFGGQWLSRRILKEWADAVEELKDYEGAIESLLEDTEEIGLDDAVLLPQSQGNLGEVISAKEWKQRLDAKLVYSIEEKKYLVQCS